LIKEQPEEPLVVVRFALHSPPYGKLLVAQGDSVYENGLIAIKDQPRRDELLSQLASVRKESLRRKLEGEITALEVRAPVSGLVKEMQVEMGDSSTSVTLKILQTASLS
jgi:multidrug resistance efflux pump